MQNRIDASISTTVRDEILDLIAQIRTKLPFLIDLSPEERQTLPKMGDKSRAFVSGALQLAEQDDHICRVRSTWRKCVKMSNSPTRSPRSRSRSGNCRNSLTTHISRSAAKPIPPRSSSINRQNATVKARHSTVCSTRSVNASPANQKKNRTKRRPTNSRRTKHRRIHKFFEFRTRRFRGNFEGVLFPTPIKAVQNSIKRALNSKISEFKARTFELKTRMFE